MSFKFKKTLNFKGLRNFKPGTAPAKTAKPVQTGIPGAPKGEMAFFTKQLESTRQETAKKLLKQAALKPLKINNINLTKYLSKQKDPSKAYKRLLADINNQNIPLTPRSRRVLDNYKS